MDVSDRYDRLQGNWSCIWSACDAFSMNSSMVFNTASEGNGKERGVNLMEKVAAGSLPTPCIRDSSYLSMMPSSFFTKSEGILALIADMACCHCLKASSGSSIELSNLDMFSSTECSYPARTKRRLWSESLYF